MEKRWQLAKPITDKFRDKFPELHPITLQLLKNRGIETQEQVDEFLLPDYGENTHDPFLFRQMIAACERVWQAIENGEKVVVFGDYDADGVTGTTILLTALREVAELAGSDSELIVSYIPHREHEGYGMNDDAVRKLAKDGIKLVVTTDCGISNASEVKLAKELGMDVIITDHHQVPEEVPECILIHPLAPNETYPNGSLSGAAVAFKFASALYQFAREQGLDVQEGREKWLLDLVAIATVTDFMKLTGENRILEKWGLVVLNKTQRPGLKKLIEAAGLELGKLDTISIGYYLGPRINAASRMDHASLALRTLMAEDDMEAARLARELNICNAERQRATEEVYRKALEMAEPGKKVQIIVGDDWSPGIIGIVAGKLVTQWGVPVFVMGRRNDGKVVGSGRSIPDFNVVELLRDSAGFLSRFGGHPEACGLTIEGEENLNNFIYRAWEFAEKKLADRDLRPAIRLDGELETSQINWELINEIERFEPFGIGNPKPLFLLRNVMLLSTTTVGKDGKHVRVSVRGDVPRETRLIAFGFAERMKEFNPSDQLDIVAEIGVNEWNGTKTIQVRMVDVQSSESAKMERVETKKKAEA